MFFNSKKKLELPSAETALPGRDAALQISGKHFVNGSSMTAPFPDGYETLVLGLGCFWGAERKFWETEGVYTTAVGYSAGHTPNPTYDEVCSGMTGHNEVVLVVYDPDKVSTEDILKVFWEAHNPTQGMRQGNDVGTQYRSGVYVTSADQKALAEATKAAYESALKSAGLGAVTTEIIDAPVFYYAEEYHQQYLAKNPSGYCGLGGTRVSYPTAAAE